MQYNLVEFDMDRVTDSIQTVVDIVPCSGLVGDLYKKVDRDGSVRYHLRGKDGPLHRVGGPAVIYADGREEWYCGGVKHRVDGPAITEPGGGKFWYFDGLLHRDDGPAVERSNGDKEWWVRGELHREGWAAIEYADGRRERWEHGKMCVVARRPDGFRQNGPDRRKGPPVPLWQ